MNKVSKNDHDNNTENNKLFVYLLYSNREETPSFCELFRSHEEATNYITECVIDFYTDMRGDGQFEKGKRYEDHTFGQVEQAFLDQMKYHIELIYDIDPNEIIYINMDGNSYLWNIQRPLTNSEEEWKQLRLESKNVQEEPTDFYERFL
ncbi:MAG: hypothetical protein Sylvanvirus11_8 [Sylvanvirus sp.]|uniref:Uncharacterized protein n=1 Tax=Sylvanvirus sp. TaxID=2487774 RepID=A0A3G5AI04_9VIRU|nr:MAG: hypothetical protein Sylvanvirus11_8 [Sylvanvirus sp.]